MAGKVGRRRFAALAIVALIMAGVTASIALPHRMAGHETDGLENDLLRPELASSTGQCGTERWSVKTGSDAGASSINLASVTPTTIAAMRAQARPASLPSTGRISPQETTVYTIDATMTLFKLETDSDYHMVIADSGGLTMITELTDPACAAASAFLPQLQSARHEFDAAYTPGSTFQSVSVPVRVMGIGFFDYLHGQTGVAPNGIELHPVLDVQFNPNPPPTPIAAAAPFTPIAPVRIFDTRPNSGFGFDRQLGTGASTTVQISGHWNVPATATAAVINVGVTNAGGAGSGYVLLYPTDRNRPMASTVNFVAGQTIANLTQVGLSQTGSVTIYNAAGSVDVFLDLAGFYGPGPGAGQGLYNSLPSPIRVLDTRTGTGGRTGMLGPPPDGYVLKIAGVKGPNGEPGAPASATAVVLNLTEVLGDTPSYLAAWPSDQNWPGNSNLNFPAGRVLANRVIVQLAQTGPLAGSITLKNSAGSAHVLVDVAGWFSSGSLGDSTGQLFAPTLPTRIYDTRDPNNLNPIGAGKYRPIAVPGGGGQSESMNVTALNGTDFSYVGVYPTAATPPNTSDINFGPGDILPNLVVTALSGGAFAAYNSAGRTDLFVDVNGVYK